MFLNFNHVRSRLTAGPNGERIAGEAGMPRSNGFDEELVRLRRCWDEAHRAFNAAPSSERDRAIHAVHASANAYFEHLDRIRLEDYVPAQVPLGREGRTVAKALPSLRLATSR